MSMQSNPAPAFLTGGGEMGARMRSCDWSGSVLGAPDTWSQSLRATVSLILNSKFPMFVAWGAELGFLYNDAYSEVLGPRHPSALGQRFPEIWHDVWADISPIVLQAKAGISSYHADLPLTLTRKGYNESTWFTFSYSPVRDEHGQVSGVFCACIDTTNQVLADIHRTHEHERMRQLFQQAPGIIAVLREPGHVFEIANEAYLELIGRRDIVGKTVSEALPELLGQGFIELLNQVYESGEPYVGRAIPVKLQRRPGAGLEQRFIDFVYQPIRDHLGQVSGIFIEGSDVTAAVRASRAMQDSEQRLQQLANTIPQMAWMADPEGRGQWYNERWLDYTGTTAEQMERDGWAVLVHPEDLPEAARNWQVAVTTGQPYRVTGRVRAAGGDYRVFLIIAAPLRGDAGEIVRWFGTCTDVTQLESAQDELRAADRQKDEFLAMLAHELRNPLAPIGAAADLLKLGVLAPGQIGQAAEVIARQVGHMTKIVDDLLDVSRVTRSLVTLDTETLNFNRQIGDAVEQVRALLELKQHQLTLQLPDDDVYVAGDRTRLTQIVSNILNNAARYTPKGGHITVRLSADTGHVQLSVTDNGMGIAPDFLLHIFEPFAQAERSPDRSQGGLGLGLALVKSLAALHGGSISAHSEGLGKGSEFILRLPRVEPDGSPGLPRVLDSTPQVNEVLKLLVVDDNRDAARTLCLLLETVGHTVTVANTARDGLDFARQHAPDVLFLDIGLPDMDGYALARALRALPETADAMLVAVTGYGQEEDKARSLAAGFDRHLVKPVTFAVLLELLADSSTMRGIKLSLASLKPGVR